MKRRAFLKFLGLGAAGAAVAIALPSVVAAAPVNAYNLLPLGLPYHIDNNGRYYQAQWREDVNCPEDRVYYFNSYSMQGYPLKDFENGRLDVGFSHYVKLDRRRIGRSIRKARRLAAPVTQAL